MKINSSEDLIACQNTRNIYIGRFKSEDGPEKIYYKRSEPSPTSHEKNIHLIIIHDFSEYHGRHNLLPEFLEKTFSQHITISWLDLLGHGLSNGARSHIDEFDTYCRDVAKMISTSKEKNPKNNIILLGHGLGALICLKLYQHHIHLLDTKLQGLILSNPCLKLKIETPLWLRYLSKSNFKFYHQMKLPLTICGHDLTNDKHLAEKYNSDPLVTQYLTIGLYRELIENSTILRTSSYFIDIPTLVLIGEKDSLCDHDMTKLFQKGMPKNKSTLINYKNMKHDLFNEDGREIVFRDVERWLNERLERLAQ